MPKTDYSNERKTSTNYLLLGLILLGVLLPCKGFGAETGVQGESLAGYYAREGNNGSPAEAGGNNIYIRFYPGQWLAMMFLPYPYAEQVESQTIIRVFDAARSRVDSSSYLRDDFGELEQKATLQIERYGYYEDRIIFECGAMAPCTIRLGEDSLELIKPGIINEHIIPYSHVLPE